jgi:hypothetical protein
MISPCSLCLYILYLNAWINLYETWCVCHNIEPILTTYFINSSHQSVCLYVCLPIIARQRTDKRVRTETIHATIEGFMDASFSIRSVLYQRKVCRSFCVSPKRWSEDSQSRQTVKHGHKSRHYADEGQQQFTGLDWTVYLPIISRQRLGKHIPAAKRNCWTCFLCGSCRIKGESVGLSMYPVSLLGNGSVNTFPRQKGIVGHVFYAVRVASKESRWLVLPRISYFFLSLHPGRLWDYPISYPVGNRAFVPGIKLPEREADHLLPFNAEVVNAWGYTSIHLYVFMTWWLIKHRDRLTFTRFYVSSILCIAGLTDEDNGHTYWCVCRAAGSDDLSLHMIPTLNILNIYCI